MKNILAVSVLAIVLIASGYTITIDKSGFEQTLVHASGAAGSAPAPAPAPAPKPVQATPAPTPPPPAMQMPAAGGGTQNYQYYRRTTSGNDTAKPEEPKRHITVTDTNDNVFNAVAMRTGFDDVIHLETAGNVVPIKIKDIASIEFGEKKVSRLETVVRLIGGKEIEGTIYYMCNLEFVAEDGAMVALAYKLGSIHFDEQRE